eukprot:evm.model.NODE_15989_length_7910_cov_52.649178.3
MVWVRFGRIRTANGTDGEKTTTHVGGRSRGGGKCVSFENGARGPPEVGRQGGRRGERRGGGDGRGCTGRHQVAGERGAREGRGGRAPDAAAAAAAIRGGGKRAAAAATATDTRHESIQAKRETIRRRGMIGGVLAPIIFGGRGAYASEGHSPAGQGRVKVG